MTIEQQLEEFINEIDVQKCAQEVATRIGDDISATQGKLSIYINEARASLELVKPYLDKNITILEIGAGLCAFSLFLKREGYNVTALEPAAGGFDFFEISKKVLHEQMGDLQLDVIEIKAEELINHTSGHFDLIFSCNVVEHIPDLEEALNGMLSVLAEDGVMVHSCPNYVVPYDPHFSIPVKALRSFATVFCD